MASGRERTYPHEKPMSSYILHTWRDAIAMADLLKDNFTLSESKKFYESLGKDILIKANSRNYEAIQNFIGLTESQRRTYLKSLKKQKIDDRGIVVFIVQSIIGALRVKDTLELRDRFRSYLVPGAGNRDTAQAIYDFYTEMQSLFQLDWPSEVFEAIDIYIDEDEDEDLG